MVAGPARRAHPPLASVQAWWIQDLCPFPQKLLANLLVRRLPKPVTSVPCSVPAGYVRPSHSPTVETCASLVIRPRGRCCAWYHRHREGEKGREPTLQNIPIRAKALQFMPSVMTTPAPSEESLRSHDCYPSVAVAFYVPPPPMRMAVDRGANKRTRQTSARGSPSLEECTSSPRCLACQLPRMACLSAVRVQPRE